MTLNLEHIGAAVKRLTGEEARGMRVRERPLKGGLDGAAVRELQVRYVNGEGMRRHTRIVAKRIQGGAARETRIYEQLVGGGASALGPRLLGVVADGPQSAILLLESIMRSQPWPWREPRATAAVIERLARFHTLGAASVRISAAPSWDYESELQKSAEDTLELLTTLRSSAEFSWVTRALPAARRVVAALPAMRQALLTTELGSTVIHGDVHTGNVLMRRGLPHPEPVFIDWARARLGSPLEDVSSWLQSAGHYEPQVRRLHDTFLRGYLAHRGMSPVLTKRVRAPYWWAGASNALAGALRYQLHTASAASLPEARSSAARVAGYWLRTVRRADAFWQTLELLPSA